MSAGGNHGARAALRRFVLGNSEYFAGLEQVRSGSAGGNRMVHNSVDVTITVIFQIFYDSGAVWDHNDRGIPAFGRHRARRESFLPGGGDSRCAQGRIEPVLMIGMNYLMKETGSESYRISRRSWLLAGLAIPLFRGRSRRSLMSASMATTCMWALPWACIFLRESRSKASARRRHGGVSLAAHGVQRPLTARCSGVSRNASL